MTTLTKRPPVIYSGINYSEQNLLTSATNRNSAGQEENSKMSSIIEFEVRNFETANMEIGWNNVNTIAQQQSYFPSKINLEIPVPNNDNFSIIQSWIGHVIAIDEDTFSARIEELAPKHSGTIEEATFDLEEIEQEDKNLMKVGSSFYWSIGYENRKGTRSKQSIIRFRRLPNIKPAEFDNIADRARQLASDLNWD